eukprot:CAMPEP_0115013430 /NCGR_PEP_ID=MMETSP0216-20121206/25402_1 /TAXON_ID=223996 /ORGANISM="Protocruzia adherens, Strain Boccale" /LENGTH=667 /DNA_ID=CAMNT_0002382825 /DNA_START=14 /DNA_END=2014 /DNA_ORIENTATION=+
MRLSKIVVLIALLLAITSAGSASRGHLTNLSGQFGAQSDCDTSSVPIRLFNLLTNTSGSFLVVISQTGEKDISKTFTGEGPSEYHDFSLKLCKSATVTVSHNQKAVSPTSTLTFLSDTDYTVAVFPGSAQTTLAVVLRDQNHVGRMADTAGWKVINLSRFDDLEVNSLYAECSLDCLYIPAADPAQLTTDTETIPLHKTKTAFDFTLKFMSGQHELLKYDFNPGEYGLYTLVVRDVKDPSNPYAAGITVTEYKDKLPDMFWVPLVVAIAILIALVCSRKIVFLLYKQYQRKREARRISNSLYMAAMQNDNETQLRDGEVAQPQERTETAPQETQKQVAFKKKRLLSLDTFRGMSLSIMIFVNYNGGHYWFFNHSAWNGLTVADLVFPWFIWIMGTAMGLSGDRNNYWENREGHKTIMFRIIERTLKLFFLGLFIVNEAYDLQKMRVPGVLQRFAISYLTVSLIVIYVPKIRTQNRMFADILPFIYQWIVVLAILFLWVILTFAMDVPGCPKGYIGPGGIADDGDHRDCTGGAALYIDKKLWGTDHIYQTPTCQPVYLTGAYDPEGTLGALNSIVLTYLGFQSGRIIKYFPNTHKGRVVRWWIWSAVCGIIALGLCGGTQNGGAIPVNKNLWSLSFILTTGCFAFFLLGAFYCLIDIKQWWAGWPFIW